jgi:hypothetical protein
VLGLDKQVDIKLASNIKNAPRFENFNQIKNLKASKLTIFFFQNRFFGVKELKLKFLKILENPEN